MKNAIEVIVFLNFLSISCAIISINGESIICDQFNSTVINSTNSIESLHNWCIADEACSTLYYQDPASPNYPIFFFLVKDFLVDFQSETGNLDLNFVVRNIICGLNGTNDINNVSKIFWILMMNSFSNQFPLRCAENEVLVISTENASTKCMCREDRSCSHTTYDVVYFYVISGLMVIMLCVFILSIISNKQKGD